MTVVQEDLSHNQKTLRNMQLYTMHLDLLIQAAKSPDVQFVVPSDYILYLNSIKAYVDKELSWWRNGPWYCDHCEEMFSSYGDWLERKTYRSTAVTWECVVHIHKYCHTDWIECTPENNNWEEMPDATE